MEHSWIPALIINEAMRESLLFSGPLSRFCSPILLHIQLSHAKRWKKFWKRKYPWKLEKRWRVLFVLLQYLTLGQGSHCGGQSRPGVEDVPCSSQSAQLTGWPLDWPEFLNTNLQPPYLSPPFFSSSSLLFPFWHMPHVLSFKPALLKICKPPSCCEVRFLRTHLHLFSVAALITYNKGT